MAGRNPIRSLAERVRLVAQKWTDAEWAADRSLRTGAVVLLFVLYPSHVALGLGTTNVNFSYGDPLVAVVVLSFLLGIVGAYRLPRYTLLVALFLLVTLVSVLVNAAAGAPISFTAWVVAVLKFVGAVAWMLAVFVLARERPATVLPAGAATSVAVGTLLASWTMYAAVTGDVNRPTGPFENPNIYANYLLLNVFFVPYLLSTWVVERWPRSRLLSLPALLVLLSAIVATGSRGTMIGLVAGALAIPILSPAIDARRAIAAATAAGVAVVAAVAAFFEYLPFTIRHTVTRTLDVKNLAVRLEQWSVGLQAFRSNPLLGIGYGQYSDYLYALTGRTNNPHNIFVYYGAEVGIVGLFAFLLILGAAVRDSLTLRTSAPGLVFVGAFVVATVAEGVGTDVDNFRSLWLAIGFVAAYHASLRDSDRTPRELVSSVRSRIAAVRRRHWSR